MASEKYALYYNRYSVCSAMVRYAFAVATGPADNSQPISLEPQEINIMTGEQLSEFYLCEVNPKGQVPVLISDGLPKKQITDSLDITLFLCERYPSLRPSEHAGEINRLLRELHAINFFTLTFRQRAERAQGMLTGIEAKLKQENISPRYKKALEYKLEVTLSEKVAPLKPPTIEAEIKRARAFVEQIENIRCQHGGSEWIFGTATPTALDASVLVFLLRLLEIDLKELIPEHLYNLAIKAKETPAMQESFVSM